MKSANNAGTEAYSHFRRRLKQLVKANPRKLIALAMLLWDESDQEEFEETLSVREAMLEGGRHR